MIARLASTCVCIAGAGAAARAGAAAVSAQASASATCQDRDIQDQPRPQPNNNNNNITWPLQPKEPASQPTSQPTKGTSCKPMGCPGLIWTGSLSRKVVLGELGLPIALAASCVPISSQSPAREPTEPDGRGAQRPHIGQQHTPSPHSPTRQRIAPQRASTQPRSRNKSTPHGSAPSSGGRLTHTGPRLDCEWPPPNPASHLLAVTCS